MKTKMAASALYYVLFLSVIFGLLLGGLILFSASDYRVNAVLDIEERLRDNASSGISYAQTHFKELKSGEMLELDLFDQGTDSVRLMYKKWGLLSVIECEAFHFTQQVKKSVLASPTETDVLPNLYLPDRGKPLSVAGQTRIEGQAYLPKAGLKRAYIEGQNYKGARLIYGSKQDAEKHLPPLSGDFGNDGVTASGELIDWEMRLSDSIQHSFSKNTLHFISDKAMRIDAVSLTGNIVLEAKDSVFISATSTLENVIIKSPIIYFESGFNGSGQFMASRRITLEEEVILTYPSCLSVYGDHLLGEANSQITIGQHASILGAVLMADQENDFRNSPELFIESNATIHGFVYNQGKTSLKGTVNGHLFTDKFYLKTPASTYENHVLNGEILNQLPAAFVLIRPLLSAEKMKIVKWLL